MGGVFKGHSPHKAKDRRDHTSRAVPIMPKLGGWLDLDSVEALRLQLWGQRVIDDISRWRHREARRREGVRP